MKVQLISYISLALLLAPVAATSDLVLKSARESELPYSLSPWNFSNSSSNFSNSISNFSNSSSNFSNSPSNFDNSPSNFANGRNGTNRLLVSRNGGYEYVGYYVVWDEGIMNIFSSKGKRWFYSPSDTDAIFGGDDGKFCGTLASLNNETVLVVTQNGSLVLLKDDLEIGESPPNARANPTQNTYTGSSSGHWIKKNVNSGSVIILEDGSKWKIDPLDKIEAMLWLPVTSITIVISSRGSPGYDYLLINTDDDEKAHAKFMGK